METFEIMRKKYPTVVKLVKVGELDKSRCSDKFLEHNFPDDMEVYVKCHQDGSFDLRGKKEEYRLIKPDAETEVKVL